ncbi:peptidylprolyl isomerase, partial [bacterium]|nr:peptidylprolyl isomerase [bacterium]
MGRVVFSFFTEKAPNHANNFKRLANSGYYNGTTFHRVIP